MSRKWTSLVVMTAAASAISTGLPMGYHIVVINTPAEVMRAWCNESIIHRYHYYMSYTQLDILWSSIVSIFLIGGCISSFFGAPIADRYGRKITMLINNLLGLLAAILFVASRHANSVEMLMVGRFVAGLSAGLVYSAIPMYMFEIGSVHQRGILGSLVTFGLAVGGVFGQVLSLYDVLGAELTWNYGLAVYGVFIVIPVLMYPFFPESPKYLYIIKGDKQACIKELVRLRGVPEEQLHDELLELELEKKTNEEADFKHGFLSLITTPELRLPLILTVVLMMGLIFSGIDALFFYSTSIFLDIGLSVELSSYGTLSLGVVLLLMSFAQLYLVHRYGRKTLIMISCVLMPLFEVLLTISLKYAYVGPWVQYLCIANTIAVVLSFTIGISAVPPFIATELFEVGPSSVAMTYSSLTFWISDFVVGFTFPIMQQRLTYMAMLPFAAILSAIGVFAWFYLPETKDRNPKDIAEMLKYGLRSNIREATPVLPKTSFINMAYLGSNPKLSASAIQLEKLGSDRAD